MSYPSNCVRHLSIQSLITKYPYPGVLLTFVMLLSACSSSDSKTANAVDLCGNALGNGNEIIPGPSAPAGEDYDSVFRSLTIHPTDPDTILMGTERNGFVMSTDGGLSWSRHRSGLRHTNGLYPEIWDIAYDPGDPSTLYAATLDSPGPVSGDYPSSMGGLYLSTDGGLSWQRSNCGLSNSRVTSVRVDAASLGTVLIGVEGGAASFSPLLGQYFEGGIYRSTDQGADWGKIDVGATDIRNGFLHLIYSAGNFFTFGFNFSDLSENIGLIASNDGGLTWTALAGLPQGLLITSLDVSADGQTLYANERDSFTMWKSIDAGLNWIETGINQANGPVAVSAADADLVLYAGTTMLYRSDDGLASFTTVMDAGRSIHDIEFAPSNPNIVYVATEGYLVYRSSDAGLNFTLVKDIRTDVL